MGITSSIGHKDGSWIERNLGPMTFPPIGGGWMVDGDIA